jgi:hypothetical protein
MAALEWPAIGDSGGSAELTIANSSSSSGGSSGSSSAGIVCGLASNRGTWLAEAAATLVPAFRVAAEQEHKSHSAWAGAVGPMKSVGITSLSDFVARYEDVWVIMCGVHNVKQPPRKDRQMVESQAAAAARALYDSKRLRIVHCVKRLREVAFGVPYKVSLADSLAWTAGAAAGGGSDDDDGPPEPGANGAEGSNAGAIGYSGGSAYSTSRSADAAGGSSSPPIEPEHQRGAAFASAAATVRTAHGGSC